MIDFDKFWTRKIVRRELLAVMNTVNSGSAGGMEGPFCLERESALGGLFQQIINEMKVSMIYCPLIFVLIFLLSCLVVVVSGFAIRLWTA